MLEAETERRVRAQKVAIPSALLGALWLAMLTLGAGPVDGRLLEALYAGGDPVVTAVAVGVTRLGDAPVLIAMGVAGALVMLWRRSPRVAVIVIAVSLVGRLLVSGQKYGIARLRPSDHDHLDLVSNPSFPSGHAANSMIVYLTLALLLSAGTRWARPAAAAAVSLSLFVGLSRVVLGVHYPSDVIGGWAFGLLWVLVALPLAERLATPPRR